jgi:hypothetical protein
MRQSPGQVVEYATTVALPDTGPQYESAAPAASVDIPSGQAVVAVGSQLTEFMPAVTAGVRRAITDSLLLAQLAANKAAADSNDIFNWYNQYTGALMKLGWNLKNADFQAQAIHSRNADLHEEIIPIIGAMLGNTVAAASLAMSVLNGLQNMNKNQPWIKLFERNSSHASGAKFQISYVDMNAQGDPSVTTAFFSIHADRAVTQVLFLKFAEHEATLRKASGDMSISTGLLTAAGSAISNRVQNFVVDFVSNVEI